jgi:hypothetical protein
MHYGWIIAKRIFGEIKVSELTSRYQYLWLVYWISHIRISTKTQAAMTVVSYDGFIRQVMMVSLSPYHSQSDDIEYNLCLRHH